MWLLQFLGRWTFSFRCGFTSVPVSGNPISHSSQRLTRVRNPVTVPDSGPNRAGWLQQIPPANAAIRLSVVAWSRSLTRFSIKPCQWSPLVTPVMHSRYQMHCSSLCLAPYPLWHSAIFFCLIVLSWLILSLSAPLLSAPHWPRLSFNTSLAFSPARAVGVSGVLKTLSSQPADSVARDWDCLSASLYQSPLCVSLSPSLLLPICKALAWRRQAVSSSECHRGPSLFIFPVSFLFYPSQKTILYQASPFVFLYVILLFFSASVPWPDSFN